MNVDIPDYPLKEETGPCHACGPDCRYFRLYNDDAWHDWAVCVNPRRLFGTSPVRVGRECPKFDPSPAVYGALEGLTG